MGKELNKPTSSKANFAPKGQKVIFSLRYQGLNPGAFYLQATPLALFFILYFETWSHKVAEGLTKVERERERGRERERKREREMRLAANPDPPVSASQSTGITSVRHNAWPPFVLFLTAGRGSFRESLLIFVTFYLISEAD